MKLLRMSSVVVMAVLNSAQAVQNAITCTTTADCAWGETCVAGDADTSVQACVPPTVCGGSSMGNCPSDDTGKLACLWRPYNDCSEGCAILNGSKGIYKCVSITRCDAYYGGASCSDGCSVNGVRCNGQGSCNMMSTNADGTPVFGCTCDNGYSGSKCETAPGSTKAPSKNASSTNDDNNDNDNGWGKLDASFWGALDKKRSSDDSSADGSNDDTTQDSSTDTSDDSSTDGSEDASGNSDSSTNSSTDASDESSSDSASNSSSASSSGAVASSESVSSTTRSGIRPGVLILVLVMTAFFLIGTVLLVAYSRRRKRQEEEEYANALASTHGVGAVGERDLAAGHTGRTPRSHIQTM
ncbi:Glycoside hydrolase [Phytophthora palmivora]|uniref:Glycoside hydrolase n=1 Tax=Phytophthora palmivora TaxID=4796 RepID=A0A2P4Y464_9STRA|nr:Glycoside hydrolase [Phytophthora palmivora]